MAELTVEGILQAKGSTNVVTIGPDATLSRVVEVECELKIGAVLVTGSDGKLVGIITERDILFECGKKTDFDTVTANDVMTRNLVTVHPEDNLNNVMDLMIGKKIRHLPIVGDNDTILGIITVRDLLFAIREADKDEAAQFVEYLQSCVSP